MTLYPQPKHPPARTEKYLSFVRGQVCAAWGTECDGVTQAAHIATAGRGIKASDYLTVPLCSHHHRQSHQVGVMSFQANEGINLFEVCAKLLVKWLEGQ